jgi:pimeloyl-ACP methyl ester carboxylesterase
VTRGLNERQAMVDVVGVHGIGQQQGGRLQMVEPWQLALSDGVERARGRDFAKPTLDIGYYGDIFVKGLDVPGDGQSKAMKAEDLILFDEDTVSFFEEVQDDVVRAHDLVDVDVTQAKKGMRELPVPVARLAGWLETKFGVAGKLLFFGDLTQVRRYQRDDVLARNVQERVREALDEGHPKVLVGHSLGSIVAYEALCLIPDHGVTTLVTLGSPLGLRSIREGLRQEATQVIPGLPPGVSSWVNVYDQNDPVALGGRLQPYWSAVVDRVVDNGKKPHDAVRYLGKSATGEPVADYLASR